MDIERYSCTSCAPYRDFNLFSSNEGLTLTTSEDFTQEDCLDDEGSKLLKKIVFKKKVEGYSRRLSLRRRMEVSGYSRRLYSRRRM